MTMGFLAGKRVLLFMPPFFGYDKDVKSELEIQGAVVDWLPDRPFDKPLMKALTKIRPEWVFPSADRLYERLLQSFGATKYDIILVINGQTLSRKMLQRIRGSFPGAQCVLYMWDSIANRSHVSRNLTDFDRVSTFDPIDAKRYQMNLRPLFYGRGFDVDPVTIPIKYQISFVGTAHTDRFVVIDRLRKRLPDDVSAYWYLYLQAPWVLSAYRLTKPDMRHARQEDFNFKPLDKKSLQAVFAESRAILDIEHPHQVGLTMRTFETLGAAKKLITTNADVQRYDFFNENNVCIIDRKNPVVPQEFLNTPFQPLPQTIRYRYSITGWLQDLLQGSQHE